MLLQKIDRSIYPSCLSSAYFVNSSVFSHSGVKHNVINHDIKISVCHVYILFLLAKSANQILTLSNI